MGNFFFKRAYKLDSVFNVIIHLKKFLQTFFSGLPRNVQEKHSFFYLALLQMGFTMPLYHYNRGELLPSPFQPYLNGGIFSVALSLGFPLLGVIQHFLPVESRLSSAMRYHKALCSNYYI